MEFQQSKLQMPKCKFLFLNLPGWSKYPLQQWHAKRETGRVDYNNNYEKYKLGR